jgi:hypothetical protein
MVTREYECRVIYTHAQEDKALTFNIQAKDTPDARGKAFEKFVQFTKQSYSMEIPADAPPSADSGQELIDRVVVFKSIEISQLPEN